MKTVMACGGGGGGGGGGVGGGGAAGGVGGGGMFAYMLGCVCFVCVSACVRVQVCMCAFVGALARACACV